MKDEKTKKDEYQKTLAAYTEAVKEFRKGKFDKAAEALRAFVEKYPGEREFVDRARTYLGIAESRLRTPKEAPDLKTADDHYYAAVFLMNNGQTEEALKLLEKGLKLGPENAKIHFLVAQAHCLSGRNEAALESLRSAIQLEKSFRILSQNESAFESLWDDKKFRLLVRS